MFGLLAPRSRRSRRLPLTAPSTDPGTSTSETWETSRGTIVRTTTTRTTPDGHPSITITETLNGSTTALTAARKEASASYGAHVLGMILHSAGRDTLDITGVSEDTRGGVFVLLTDGTEITCTPRRSDGRSTVGAAGYGPHVGAAS